MLVGLLVAPRARSGWVIDALTSASVAALAIPFANAVAGDRHIPRSTLRPRLLGWSLHTPRQETRSRKPVCGRRRNDLRAWPGCGRNCLVLTNRTSHLEKFAGLLREAGHDPVILRGGMGAKSPAAAPARPEPQPA